MAQDRFMIASFESGLQNDLTPWQTPEDSFTQLDNAYVFRGRVKKRFGSTLMGVDNNQSIKQLKSRLRIALTDGQSAVVTDGDGDASGTIPGRKFGAIYFEIGQTFSIGSVIYTVYQGDGSVSAALTMLKTVATITATFNANDGAYVFAGAPASTQVYYYPAEPVMGFAQHEQDILYNNPSIAFDTQFSYLYASGAWNYIDTAAAIWHGSDSDFFWSASWRGAAANTKLLFTTNFYVVNRTGAVDAADDAMKYYNGTDWVDFNPVFKVAGNNIITAKLIVGFKDHLLLFDTIERNAGSTTNTAFVNRCRFSHNGSPLSATAWLEQNEVGATGGGFIDAPIQESIVGCEFIKDRLLVYFENSTWEIAYTNNHVQPYIWQKINTELGSESAFSTVPFDKIVLNVGPTGIHACNGINVERIDDKIPDDIFKVRTDNEGISRVAGIRDFTNEMVYWTLPTTNAGSDSDIYPNKVLVFNYKNGSWGYNDDSITALGYFEQQTGLTWEDLLDTSWADIMFAWDSGTTKTQYKQVLAGNQEGFTFKLDSNIASNCASLQITHATNGLAFTTLVIKNHNLQDGDFIKITTCVGTNTLINNNIYKIDVFNLDTIRLDKVGILEGYAGGGCVARVSRIDVRTKWLNPYIDDDRRVSLSMVNFGVVKTSNGTISIDAYPSSTTLSLNDAAIETGTTTGEMVLETYPYDSIPLEASQKLLWHRVYFIAEGSFVQIRLYLNDAQMTNVSIVESGFELQGMILYTSQTGE